MAVRNALIDLGPLRTSPGFRRLWIGRTFSGFGSQMTLVAVMYQIWQTTHSTVWTGAIGLAHAIPVVTLAMFAGSIVDRVDRRAVYLVAASGQAMVSILLAVQGFFGHLPVLGLLALLAAQSCFGAGGAPAARTFVPRLLPKHQVAAGLALNQISFQAAMLVGPAAGGVVLGWLGVGGCYAIDAASFVLAIWGAFGLAAMRPVGESPRPGLQGILDGVRFVAHNAAVGGALLTDLAATVLSFPISLFPLINAERFHDSPRTLGLFLTAIAVGGVIAATFSGTFTRLARPGMVMLSGAALWGLALAGFAVVSNPWIGLSLLVFAGIGDTLSAVSRSTIVLLHTPDALRGRVAAAEQIVGQAGPDVGNMRAGVLAGATSGTVSLLTGGLMCVSAVLLVALFRPELRRSAAGLRTADLRVHPEVIERARKDRHHGGSGLGAGLGGAAEVVALTGRQRADEQPDDKDHRSDT